MKIVILGTAWPLRGGLAAFNHRLAEEYGRQGHEVVIFGFRLQYPSFLFPGKSQYSEEPAPEGLNIRPVVNSVNPLNWLINGRRIRKLAPDLLIIKFWLPFMAPCLGTIAGIARRNGKTRVISVVDNMIPHEHRPGDEVFTRYFVKRVDGFVAMTQSVLDDIALFDAHKKRLLCPHPLYDHFGDTMQPTKAREALGIDPSTKLLLFFGLIRDYKGLDILIRAMAEPSVKSLGIKLLVAGEYYTKPEQYLDLIHHLGLSESILLHTAFIPDSKVALYFNAADLVVQPYKTATQSGVTQIAYHFNKPMVVTRVGGLAEMVPDGIAGYVVDPEPGAVAAAISEFYREEKSDTLTAGVIAEKSKYTWKRLTEAIDSLL
ncbi:MAG TPA: glycosyltransferase [Bacteroidales bacterium]|nr:glycosyltransferase [Bacteroidales bacterium]HRZ50048.1 glycosyltransferase [Bacteroidales bacterium]